MDKRAQQARHQQLSEQAQSRCCGVVKGVEGAEGGLAGRVTLLEPYSGVRVRARVCACVRACVRERERVCLWVYVYIYVHAYIFFYIQIMPPPSTHTHKQRLWRCCQSSF